MSAIASRYEAVLRQVIDAADVAGRDPDEVTVVGVTKTVGVDEVRQAIAAGMRDFGENRVQEFLGKHGLFPDVRWHFIGTLQSNKARDVVGKAYLIHSIDTFRLLEMVDRHARDLGVVQPVLIQVNVAAEASKHGFEPEEVADVLWSASEMDGIEVRGLMTMAPLGRPEDARLVFRGLADLARELEGQHIDGVELHELSMGMTNDFKVAVEEGATIVRVGRAIFGR